MNTLSLDDLRTALSGQCTAIRRVTRLEPVGEKIFPPTYEGGEYAVEKRKKVIDGRTVEFDTVLLDSVQSQANRMEMALLRAYDAGRIQMPLAWVDFASAGDDPSLAEVGRVTALEAPHRICDAIFRDSMLDGGDFPASSVGQAIRMARASSAKPLFEFCPTALLFGFWDSSGKDGGLGAKLQRALVSEVVGYGWQPGVRPASRLDRIVERVPKDFSFFRGESGQMVLDSERAIKDRKGKPVKLKLTELNHGNVTPSLHHQVKDKDTNRIRRVLNHGGGTIEFAEQQAVLSVPALRRLRFGVAGEERDLAGRAVIAALALAALCLLDDDGFDLRSRCLLNVHSTKFDLVHGTSQKPFQLDSEAALELLKAAVVSAKSTELVWRDEPLVLKPSPDLVKVVVESRRRTRTESASPDDPETATEEE